MGGMIRSPLVCRVEQSEARGLITGPAGAQGRWGCSAGMASVLGLAGAPPRRSAAAERRETADAGRRPRKAILARKRSAHLPAGASEARRGRRSRVGGVGIGTRAWAAPFDCYSPDHLLPKTPGPRFAPQRWRRTSPAAPSRWAPARRRPLPTSLLPLAPPLRRRAAAWRPLPAQHPASTTAAGRPAVLARRRLVAGAACVAAASQGSAASSRRWKILSSVWCQRRAAMAST